MSHKFLVSSLTAAVALSLSATAMAKDAGGVERNFEQITVIGSQAAINDIPGSATFISDEELQKFEFTDISRVLASVPGVYVQEEDGYGLRPNIGMRGTGTGRNDKISVMEDGVLVAPAPYSAPSAYYFPTMGRMESIEVLKGAASVKYGPRTTGGVLNLLSRSLPTEANSSMGMVDAALGSDGYYKGHAYFAKEKNNTAGLIEVFSYGADGFKELPVGDDNTGFEKNDVLVKFGHTFGENDAHNIEFKAKYSEETSDETYMGLTNADYQENPNRRYAASQNDEMNTRHNAYQVNYAYRFGEGYEFLATAYLNDFHRNWYKASKVSESYLEQYSEFEANPTAEGIENIGVKANNRDYQAKGVQSELHIPAGDHYITVGVRYHEDEMDRFQWEDKYTLNQDLSMTLTSQGAPGSNSNRLDSAKASTLFIQDEWTMDALVVSAGLRYEDITITREEWAKSDPTRSQGLTKDISNDTEILVPSLGATYTLNDNVTLLAGIQKGYAPAAPGNADQDEEESVNIEFGSRFNANGFNGEVIAFYSDYDNMHGNCTAAVGCSDDNIGDQYNYGEVEVSGFEFSAGRTFNTASVAFPVKLTYTYTDSEFKNTFDSEIWGSVEKGDAMPYVPENQVALSFGAEVNNFVVNSQIRYVSDAHADLSDSGLNAIDSRVVWDLAAKYLIDENQKVYLSVDNLFDKTYIANRANGGIQPGKPRSVQMGYSYSF
ncbi:TonB-dependent receptor [Pseudoalteromonas sp. Scap03]|jgi:Fe(3+) dicitrate transport protein|uniref:TonB-dependent receptor family protein n=1 Tax=Pseudoalteromonas TaxID=53246 RepID=UPI0006BAA6C8|nr:MULTISPECIES: TonB-dependent receptor [Pseudoalteromonas]KPH90311.1 ligand-gated channel protein [Pseudoalteromonas undina]NWL15358.1 TonB-dependent receptor [Pseudoalteromonas sp. Scap03]QLE80509.1 TonB-dependent receptor [Pseudoalteromonas sp. Scap25]QLE88452.1 TonB-dependent receptor [Pseudoalteromonas sp. Scap06]